MSEFIDLLEKSDNNYIYTVSTDGHGHWGDSYSLDYYNRDDIGKYRLNFPIDNMKKDFINQQYDIDKSTVFIFSKIDKKYFLLTDILGNEKAEDKYKQFLGMVQLNKELGSRVIVPCASLSENTFTYLDEKIYDNANNRGSNFSTWYRDKKGIVGENKRGSEGDYLGRLSRNLNACRRIDSRILPNYLSKGSSKALAFTESSDIDAIANWLGGNASKFVESIDASKVTHAKNLLSALRTYSEFLSAGDAYKQEKPLCALNQIYFGAPGAGKSYKLSQLIQCYFSDHYERVTFYADYLHSQFVGAYKPITVPAKDEKGNDIRQVVYQFRPGPFTRVLIRALNNPNNDYALVIEELNRAEAASVFGDVFQLLDRGDNGCSEYAITVSEDLLEYLKQTEAGNDNYLTDAGRSRLRDLTGQMDQIDCSQIVIPSNMYILATMNSADQGVFPLDTAFKRRWDFEYVGIDDGEDARDENGDFIIKDRDWVTKYRKTINKNLLAAGIPEDKQMGPFFLGNPSLEYGMEGFDKAMKNKIIMYLFEDAAKYHLKEVFNFDSIGKALYPRESPDSQVQTDHYSLSMLFEAWDKINYGIFRLESLPNHKKDDSNRESKQGTADDSATASDGSAQDSNE